MTFHIRPAFGQYEHPAAMWNGVKNWKIIWNCKPREPGAYLFGIPSLETQSITQPGILWKRIGFMKHAPEFWLHSRIMLERVTDRRDHISTEVDSDLGDLWHGQNESSHVSDIYDLADMGQLNDLITNFQGI